MFYWKIKEVFKTKLFQNFVYISILQLFLLLAPLITYPYLVRILGADLYGYVITAQVLASYFSIIVDFGSNSVCTKHVSVNRENHDKLSEIVSSVLYVRMFLWFICFVLYLFLVYLIPSYRVHFWLFVFSYGLTLNEVLFPQYFFQGIEKMKYSTLVNIVIKTAFILLVFIVVDQPDDYLCVPLLYTIGYCLGGVVALYMIFGQMKIKLVTPRISVMKFYIKDSSAILATDLICTIKDKFNYFLIGSFVGMNNVVVYDIGSKINTLIYKPTEVVRTVLLPYFAKTKSVNKFKKALFFTVGCSIIIVAVVNVFLPYIVGVFIHTTIDLLPIRIFTLAPIMLSASIMIANNVMIAWGYNKYVLYSIIVTTTVYIILLVFFYLTKQLGSLYSFIIIALISYLTELLYRLYAFVKIRKQVE